MARQWHVGMVSFFLFSLVSNNFFAVEQEIHELNDRIQMNEKISEERWDVYLNADPVKHVEDIEWVDENSCVDGGCLGVPLVTIAGITGTICADNTDKNTRDFLCQKLTGIDWADSWTDEQESVSHFDEKFVGYPVMLNNIQCIEGATSFDNCTSGPMGFEHCDSERDLQLGCGWGAPPTLVPSE